MKTEKIQDLINDFEACTQRTENGVEFWLARNLQYLLGYDKWDNFKTVIEKAKISCKGVGHVVFNHFIEVKKKVSIGSGGHRQVADIRLTRYACYLIAQNSDPRKEKVAFAQTYFAVQTRKLEVIQTRIQEIKRLSVRKKLAGTEKELSKVIYEHIGQEHHFGIIRSEGDRALFGYATEQMKEKWDMPQNRALADFAPTIILKAKDFASEITIFNVEVNQMQTGQEILIEHFTNNESVRKTLTERGIWPESLPPAEDAKKLERKLKSDEKKGVKNPNLLEHRERE